VKTFAAPVVTAINSGALAIVQLLAFEFASTPIYLNTSTWDLVWDGKTYKGAAGLGTVSAITDKPGEVQGLNLQMFGDASHVAVALDSGDVVQGTPLVIRTAIIEVANYTVLDAPVEWTGTLDTMSIGEDGQQCTVNVSAESRGVDLLRGNAWLYSHEEQMLINATDNSFKYVVDQQSKPIIWPAKAFYYQ
jgi:hypothetical protein